MRLCRSVQRFVHVVRVDIDVIHEIESIRVNAISCQQHDFQGPDDAWMIGAF